MPRMPDVDLETIHDAEIGGYLCWRWSTGVMPLNPYSITPISPSLDLSLDR